MSVTETASIPDENTVASQQERSKTVDVQNLSLIHI